MSNSAFGNDTTVDPNLPVTADGLTYHLSCKSSDLADRIILVGDPGRVRYVAEFFDKDSIRFRSEHREIFIATGTYKGTPVSVLSTGMGTDNLEIVINEIHLLKEYDFERRVWRPRAGDATPAPAGTKVFDPSSVKLIRVGTCGSPYADMPIGALAVTRYAIGMDNTGLYYKANQIPHSADLEEVRRVTREQTGLRSIDVYTTKAHPAITRSIVDACETFNRTAAKPQPYVVGTTATASGFYACQGRAVGRFSDYLTVPNMAEEFSKLKFNVSEGTEIVANIEMETSSLCYLSGLLGYQAGTACVVIAKRAGDSQVFATAEQTKTGLANGIRIALDAIVASQ